ncbi:MAG: helix-turn-helix domain-containing protein [Myxococcota bacterium]
MTSSTAGAANGPRGAHVRGQFQSARRALDAAALAGTGLRVVIQPDGAVAQDLRLPAELVTVMVQALDHLSRGDSVSVVPTMAELTTQEAAELLGVSRPFFVKLLDEGRIPCRKVGSRRRVRLEDVMAYRRAEESRRSALLDDLANEAQRLRLGYPG